MVKIKYIRKYNIDSYNFEYIRLIDVEERKKNKRIE